MILEMGLGISGAVAAYLAGRYVYDDLYVRWMNAQTDRVRLDAMKQRAALQALTHIPADANGRLGAVVRPDGSITVLDTGRIMDAVGVRVVDQLAEAMDARIRLLLAARGVGGGQPEQMLEIPEMLPQLPDYIPASKFLSGPASYHRLVLGQAISNGRLETVTADLADLVHIAVGGSSGWGKSWFLRWLAYQLTHSIEDVQLALIDLEGATLAPFAKADNVLWPLADDEITAVAIMRELTDELDRRKELYAQYADAGVDSLYSYNDVADEPLAPLVCIADEITALMADRNVEDSLRTLALRGRKYGLWLMLAGQDWKASTLDTAIRNQLATCIQFKTKDETQSRVLLRQPDAAHITNKGRAYAWLPGREMVEIQAPAIEARELGIGGSGPLYPMPEKVSMLSDFDARVQAAWDSGLRGPTAICREVTGQTGGQAFYDVKDALDRLALTSTTTE